jgi:hypothetical protein
MQTKTGKFKGETIRQIFLGVIENKEVYAKWYWNWLVKQPKQQIDKLIDGAKLWELLCRYDFETAIHEELNFKDKTHQFEKEGNIE